MIIKFLLQQFFTYWKLHSKLYAITKKCYQHLRSDSRTNIAEVDQPIDFKSISDTIKLQFPSLAHQSKGCVLVEGMLATYGPNYWIRTALVAKAIEEQEHLTPVVILQAPNPIVQDQYEMFGITSFLFFPYDTKSFFHFLQSLFKTLFLMLKGITPESLLSLSFKDILLGDLIYDDALKHNHTKDLTIHSLTNEDYSIILRAFWLTLEYKRFFKRSSIKYLIATHATYIDYGILLRTATRLGITALETTDSFLGIHLPDEKGKSANLMNGIYTSLLLQLRTYKDLQKKIEAGRSNLTTRFEGEQKQIDVALAFTQKETYSKKRLSSSLGAPLEKPYAFIFAHVFTDSPHLSCKLLYKDYYVWLKETLAIAGTVDDVVWLLKPHPSQFLYGDANFKQLLSSVNNDNIYIVPPDFNTKSIIGIADAIITCQGTIGLEASCFGIPVVVAGTPFYANFGFCHAPRSQAEYVAQLHKCHALQPPSLQQQEQALLCFQAFFEQSTRMQSTIPAEILDHVWGYAKGGRNINKAYALLDQHIQKKTLRDLPLFQDTQRILTQLPLARTSNCHEAQL